MRCRPRVCTRSSCRLNTFCTSRRFGRALRAEALQPADVDVAGDRASRNERRQRLRGVGLDVLTDARPAEPESGGVQRRGREDLAMLAGEELVAREELARKLRIIGRQELIGVVEGVAREDLPVRPGVEIDPALHEMLVERLREREVVDREPLPEQWSVGARELGEKRRDRRVDADHAASAGCRAARCRPARPSRSCARGARSALRSSGRRTSGRAAAVRRCCRRTGCGGSPACCRYRSSSGRRARRCGGTRRGCRRCRCCPTWSAR